MKKRMKSHLGNKYLIYTNLISLLLFLLLTILISVPTFMTKLDLSISKSIPLIYNPILTNFMQFITSFGNTLILVSLTILLSLFLLYKKQYKNLLILISSVLIGFILEIIIKSTLHKTRPIDAIIDFTRFSFPSGHALMSLIFYSIFILYIKDYIKNKILKISFIILNIILIILIGLSRIYLNFHWFSDVIGGYMIGIYILSLVLMILNKNISIKNKK